MTKRIVTVLSLGLLLAIHARTPRPLLAQSPVPAAQIEGWALADIVPVESIEGVRTRLLSPVVAPDASRIAWIERSPLSICVHDFDAGEPICTPLPEAVEPDFAEPVWSWEGSTLAVTDRTRIVIFDVAAQTFTTLPGEDNSRDDHPAWTRDGTLYFIRTTVDAEDQPVARALYRLDDPPGTPQRLFTFSDDHADHQEFQPINGRFSLSPDDRVLALTTTYISAELPAALWLFDLESGVLTPVITAGEVLIHGMPGWMTTEGWRESTLIQGLNWTADGESIVVLLENPFYQIRGVFPAAYLVQVTTGAVTPWMDFSSVPDNDTFFETDPFAGSGQPTFYDRHEQAIYLQEIDALLYANWSPAFNRAGISALTEPQSDPLRLFSTAQEFYFSGGPLRFNNYGSSDHTLRAILADHVITLHQEAQ